ncbi:hypothetical protein ACQUY5_30245 [Bacillus cereus]|uniref:hypothetical protein n=1 Tax=Bacillus cereus TaxID=1396 RepID=UPI003D186DC2
MKQPKIKIQDKIYKVLELGFNSKTGELDKVLFQIKGYEHCHIFKRDTVFNDNLTGHVPITETTREPYHSHYHAPDLISLLIFEDEEDKETLEENDINHIHDYIYEATKLSQTSSQTRELVQMFPTELMKSAKEWGWNDSVVGDKVYYWAIDNVDLIKQKLNKE